MGTDTRKYDVMVAGYTCADLTPEFRRGEKAAITEVFKPGRLTEIEGISFIPGGVVPNTGLALKKFNKKVYLNGLVGDDFIGKVLTESLGQDEVSEGIQITEKEGTAFGIVIALPGIDRIFLESAGCNKIFDTNHIDYNVAVQSRIFHFGYPPLLRQFYLNGGSQLVEMFATVLKAGTVTSLDFSLPDPESESGSLDWQKILRKVLPFVKICTPSLEEVLQMMMPEKLDIIDRIPESVIMEIGMRMVSYGVEIVLIKAAHRGVYLFTGNISSVNKLLGNTLDEKQWNDRELRCDAYPADPAKIINATGAGDTSIAAFLSAILEGDDPERSLQYAAMAGRNKLYCNNIVKELPGWEDMTEQINSGTKKITELSINQQNK